MGLVYGDYPLFPTPGIRDHHNQLGGCFQSTREYPKWISEHAFDKLRLIDCMFAEFDLESAEVNRRDRARP